MNTCADCSHAQPCAWFCPIHGIHHPVRDMVTYCLEKATSPVS